LPAHDASPDTADIMVGSSKYGEMIEIPSQEANPAQWIGTAFAHTDLVRIAWMLRQGSVSLTKGCAPVSIPMTTIGAIGLLGPDRRDMTDTFGRAKTATQYPAFRLQSTDKIGTIEAKPNEWLQPHIGAVRGRKVRDAALIWRRAGPIMIPERSQVDTQRTLALRLPCPALSQGWWPLRLRQQNDKAEKALVLWLNSTLGILTLLAHRVPTRGAWMQFKRQTIQSMPTLDVTALSEPHIERLARTYDSIAQRELQRFADLANDDVRAEIDNVFSDVLGLIGIDAIRAELSREPIIGLKPCSEQKISDDTDDRLEFELL
jgi:hypothetical protein